MIGRFMPRSLYGQIMLATALALLLIQGLNAVFRYRIIRSWEVVEAASFAATIAGNHIDRDEMQDHRRSRRRASVAVATTTGPLSAPEFHGTEQFVQSATAHLQSVFPEISQVRLLLGPARALPRELRILRGRGGLFGQDRGFADEERRAVLLSLQTGDHKWVHAAVLVRTRQLQPLYGLMIETILIYLAVMVPLAIIARRIARPLAQLKQRIAVVGEPGEVAPMQPVGPSDVSMLIESFNSAEARINALLMEKDVMLGAIGHDLKTPLASLRVRVESVEDAVERDKMAGTISEMVAILDDILVLARLGRSSEAMQIADIGALVETVVAEFPDDSAIRFVAPQERVAIPVRPVLLRRALRNLVDNALKYGGAAEISLLTSGSQVEIIIDDAGPGVPPEKLAEMFEPFVRDDETRNRATGGSGLGLTIARAILQAHGGAVSLANRAGGGLRARVTLPKS